MSGVKARFEDWCQLRSHQTHMRKVRSEDRKGREAHERRNEDLRTRFLKEAMEIDSVISYQLSDMTYLDMINRSKLLRDLFRNQARVEETMRDPRVLERFLSLVEEEIDLPNTLVDPVWFERPPAPKSPAKVGVLLERNPQTQTDKLNVRGDVDQYYD
ncbi:hypothetical protein ACP3V3_02030 [Vibrio sp. PNB22_3_1]